MLSDVLQIIGVPQVRAEEWAAPLEDAMVARAINTPDRQAAFLAQILHESGLFKWLRELWGPTPEQQKYEPPNVKAQELGNTQTGDGFRFRGRGLIQITGRANYAAVAAALGIDCENHPEMLETPAFAAASATLFWQTHGLNELADAGEFQKITRRINGGLNGEADREALWAKAKAALST